MRLLIYHLLTESEGRLLFILLFCFRRQTRRSKSSSSLNGSLNSEVNNNHSGESTCDISSHHVENGMSMAGRKRTRNGDMSQVAVPPPEPKRAVS